MPVYCQKHRILIQNCDSYEGLRSGRYIRPLAVRSGEENDQLIQAFGSEDIGKPLNSPQRRFHPFYSKIAFFRTN